MKFIRIIVHILNFQMILICKLKAPCNSLKVNINKAVMSSSDVYMTSLLSNRRFASEGI